MIAIIDYEAGNLTSVERALVHLGVPCRVTADAGEIRAADRVVFPGVGAAAAAMGVLRARGLDAVIRDVIGQKKPFLGICLGAQIMLDHSEEDGGTECLGIIPGNVRRFAHEGKGFKIPHMGWNDIRVRRSHPILEGIGDEDRFYFVHSYYLETTDAHDCVAMTDYGVPFVSVMGRGAVFAVQFHPEKSGPQGLRILKNFAAWKGEA
mgnify:CR=1 FL=1